MNQTIKTRIEQIGRGEVPEGYKKTKAGIVPLEWSLFKLKDISMEIHESAGNSKYETLSISAGIGFVNQANKFGKEISGAQYSKYTVLQKGDFSYNKGNSKKYPQGCIYQLKDREKAVVPNVFESFRLTKGYNDYYEQLFIHGYFNSQLFSKINHGVRDDGLLNLRGDDFYSCYIPFPPIEEQEKIAEILSAQDKVISLKEKLIEQKKQQKTLLSNQLFSDAYIKEKSVYGKKVKLGEICAVVTDYVSNGSFKNLKDNVQYLEEGYAVLIRLADFNNNFDPEKFIYVSEKAYKFLSRSSVYPGDIIISNVGSVGSIFRAPDLKQPMSLAPNTILVRTKICDDYFYQFIASAKGQELLKTITSTTAQPKFNKTDFKGLEMYIPDLKTQKYIAQILNYADEEIKLLRKDLEEEKQKKKALMQLLLTGIVRVV